MEYHRPSRRAALRMIAAGGAGLLAGSVAARQSAAQSLRNVVIGRVPVNALPSNCIGPLDFFREEGIALEPTRFDNAGQMFQTKTAGDLVADEAVIMADRIVVMARRPSFVLEVDEVDLPRPRLRDRRLTGLTRVSPVPRDKPLLI